MSIPKNSLTSSWALENERLGFGNATYKVRMISLVSSPRHIHITFTWPIPPIHVLASSPPGSDPGPLVVSDLRSHNCSRARQSAGAHLRRHSIGVHGTFARQLVICVYEPDAEWRTALRSASDNSRLRAKVSIWHAWENLL